MEEIRSADACLSLKTLSINGKDLMALGMPAGRELGVLLSALLDEVIEERLPNDRQSLLAAAKERISRKA